MALAMAVTLPAGAGGTDVMPLPPRPDAVVAGVEKTKTIEPTRKLNGAIEGSSDVEGPLVKRLSTVQSQQRLSAAPLRVLRQPGAPLRSQEPVLGPQAVRAPNGPWPVIILAAGEPVIGAGARKVEFDNSAFKADPDYEDKPYEQEAQVNIYGGKTAVDAQRPIVELGTPFYQVGPLGQGTNVVGQKNLVFGHLYVFGDWRTAVAYNDNGNGDEVAQIATRANLDVDLGLPSP